MLFTLLIVGVIWLVAISCDFINLNQMYLFWNATCSISWNLRLLFFVVFPTSFLMTLILNDVICIFLTAALQIPQYLRLSISANYSACQLLNASFLIVIIFLIITEIFSIKNSLNISKYCFQSINKIILWIFDEFQDLFQNILTSSEWFYRKICAAFLFLS